MGLLGIPALLTPRAPRCATLDDPLRDTPGGVGRVLRPHFLRVPSARSGRMPRESLDAPENLSKEAPCQVALSHVYSGPS